MKTINIPGIPDNKEVDKNNEYRKTLSSDNTSFYILKFEEGIETIGVSAFEDCSRIRKIILPDTLKEIKEFAFFNCKNLETIEGGNKLINIGRSAFQNCSSLDNVFLSNSVKKIDAWAFSSCTSLKTIEMGEHIESIGHQAFADCKQLNTITILSTAVNLGYEVFYNLPNNSTIKIPLSFSNIFDEKSQGYQDFIPKQEPLEYFLKDSIFYKISNQNKKTLKVTDNRFFKGKAILPDRIIFNNVDYVVTEIENNAFKGCDGLTTLMIPANIHKIGTNAFASCHLLNLIIVKDENPYYYSDVSNRTLIKKDEHCLLYYAVGSDIKTFTIPSNIKRIDKNAFVNFNLKRITFLSQEVPEIEENAFRNGNIANCKIFVHLGCKDIYFEKLKKHGFNNKEMFFDSGKFQDKQGIWYKIISEREKTVEIIGNRGFKGKANIPEEINFAGKTYKAVKIEINAFYNCNTLTSIDLPDSIASIEKYAFWGCKKLTNINLPNSITSIGNRTFFQCSALTSINLPSSVTSIGEYAFGGCKNLININLSKSITSIGSCAFYKCSALISINLPNTTTLIGAYAFYCCRGLTSINLPNSITSIGQAVFAGCKGIKVFNVDKNNSNYKSVDGVLFNKKGDILIQYPPGKKDSIYSMPKGIKTIERYAFGYCNNLTIIDLSDSLTLIRSGAFVYCSSMKKIICNATTPPTIDSNAFNDVYRSSIVKVPKGYVSRYKNAKGWNKFKTIIDDVLITTGMGGYGISLINLL